MTNLNIQAIEPLVASKKTEGSTLSVTFRCPESGTEVSSSARLTRTQNVKQDAVRSVKRNLWSGLRRSVARAVTDALGSGVASRVAYDVTNSAVRQGEGATTYNKDEVNVAIVEAFTAVQSSFRWNTESNGFTALPTHTSAFERRLADAPVKSDVDQGVLARALLELAKSDGNVAPEELTFIAGFIDPSSGSVEEYLQRDALTQDELAQTAESTRPSIMMLAWACAMCDEDLADEEVTRLEELATGFGMTAAESQDLRKDAQQFLLQQALSEVYVDGKRNADAFAEVTMAASKMGINEAQTAEIDASYREAVGIA